MTIKLDENLPTGLVPLLTALGHEVDTVPARALAERTTMACGARRKRTADSSSRKISTSRTPASTRQGLTTVCCWPGFRSRVASPCRRVCFGPKRRHMVRLSGDSDTHDGAGQKTRLTTRGKVVAG